MTSGLILRAVGALALAFVLTSAAMFWISFFEPKTGWYDIADGYFGNGYDTPGILTKLSPFEERSLLEAISDELKKKSSAELFQMNAYDDVCANNLVDCRDLTSAKVKPFIGAILSDRQASETALYARTADIIAAGSLFVSFLALILSYRRKSASKAS